MWLINTLIVYTYPNHNSLNYAFLEKVVQGCQDNEELNTYQVLDLYEEHFDPVLVFNEHKRRRDMYVDPKLDKYRKQLQWADQLVFVYPIWWGRPPLCCLGTLIRCLPPILPIEIPEDGFQRDY